MEWKHYGQKVVARHHVMIEGWPPSIPFKNLSAAASPLADLDTLFCGWQDGTIYWKLLTSTEADKLIDDMMARGEIQEPVQRRSRSDRGKKRKRQAAPDSEDESGNGNTTVPADRNRKRQKKTISAATAPSDPSSGDSEDH